MNTIRVSNNLDPDQARRFVGPDLSPNFLQRLSTDVISIEKINFLLSADFFSKSTFYKNSFMNTIRMSNRLDPDQTRHFVGPDLDPNCLQRLSADDISW